MKINVVRPGDDPDGPPALVQIYAEPHERKVLEKMIEAIVGIVQQEITPTTEEQ